MKNILIDLNSKKFEYIEKKMFPMEWGIYLHKKYETYKYDVYSDKNIFAFGRGVLPIVGGNRLIFTFRSPLWNGFHVSALGGAGYQFKSTGLDNVAIIGKCEEPTVIVIEGKNNDTVNIEYIPIKELDFDINNYNNIYEFKDILLKHFKDKNHRSFVVGPASITTNMGAILSKTVRGGKYVEGSEGWAARGGIGSVLYRAHNILGVVFYGDENPKKRSEEKELEKEIRKIVENYYKKPYMKVILEHTKKYRYDENTKTGGTFGNDYHLLEDKFPMFNWQMPYIPKEKREKLHNIIMKYYVDIFNEESIYPKKWTNCGEPCPVLCKKYRNGLKLDYEPYNGNGPLLGIFHLYAADKVVHKVDSLGYDAIEFGNLLGWVFELLHRGLLKPEEVGASENIIFDIEAYNNEEDIIKISEHNSKIALEISETITFHKTEVGKILSLGIRRGGALLNEKFKNRLKEGDSFTNYAVYDTFGNDGHISPTLYWAIGNFMPLLIQGKYLTYYKCGEFLEPEDLGLKCAESAFNEITIENLGFCRFHRKWVMNVVEDIVKKIRDCDLKEIAYTLFNDICQYDKNIVNGPTYIESERVKDLIVYGSKEFGNDKWYNEFKKDREGKLKEYTKIVVNTYSNNLKIDWKFD